MFKQCRLRKGITEQIVYVPIALARLGGWLRILNEDGWHIESVAERATDKVVSDGRDQHGLFGSLQ